MQLWGLQLHRFGWVGGWVGFQTGAYKLPRQVACILDSRVHAKRPGWRKLVAGVAHKEDPAALVSRRHPGLRAWVRHAVLLVKDLQR